MRRLLAPAGPLSLRDEAGQGLVEYIVIIGSVAVVAIAAFSLFALGLNGKITGLVDALTI